MKAIKNLGYDNIKEEICEGESSPTNAHRRHGNETDVTRKYLKKTSRNKIKLMYSSNINTCNEKGEHKLRTLRNTKMSIVCNH